MQQSGNENLTNEQQSVLKHKEQLKSKINEIYDISEHSLVFSKKTEMLNTSDTDFAYLNNEVSYFFIFSIYINPLFTPNWLTNFQFHFR